MRVVVTSPDIDLLAQYNAYVSNEVSVIHLVSPEQDALKAAQESGARYVNPRWGYLPGALDHLTPAWIKRLHTAGLGITSWPVRY